MAGGGKGSNQALAAARLSAKSHMIGCIGSDDFGKKLKNVLTENGVDCSQLHTMKNAPTGTAVITVTDDGNNSVIVAQGANSLLDDDVIMKASDVFEASDAALFQMESPAKTVAAGLKLSRQHGCMTFLSAEPPYSLPEDVWGNIDYLILNERALSFYAGRKQHKSVEEMADEILKRGVKCLAVTQSAKGGMIFAKGGDHFSFDAFDIRAVDHTGARDAFCAGFCVGLCEGMPLKRAAKFASACGALACTKIGAHPSMPWRHQVSALLGEAADDEYEL